MRVVPAWVCIQGLDTEEGTKAERAGQNNGLSQMPRYVTGLFEFTIVKATIVGEGLSPQPRGGREAGSCDPLPGASGAGSDPRREASTATQGRAGLLLTARRCPSLRGSAFGCWQRKKAMSTVHASPQVAVGHFEGPDSFHSVYAP